MWWVLQRFLALCIEMNSESDSFRRVFRVEQKESLIQRCSFHDKRRCSGRSVTSIDWSPQVSLFCSFLCLFINLWYLFHRVAIFIHAPIQSHSTTQLGALGISTFFSDYHKVWPMTKRTRSVRSFPKAPPADFLADFLGDGNSPKKTLKKFRTGG